MPNYIVRKTPQSNGEYEVHDESSMRGCLPQPDNRVYLGLFPTCDEAVAEADRLGYRPANGCFWCANSCHTG